MYFDIFATLYLYEVVYHLTHFRGNFCTFFFHYIYLIPLVLSYLADCILHQSDSKRDSHNQKNEQTGQPTNK